MLHHLQCFGDTQFYYMKGLLVEGDCRYSYGKDEKHEQEQPTLFPLRTFFWSVWFDHRICTQRFVHNDFEFVHNDLIEISDALSPGKNLNFEGFPQYIGPSNAFFSFSGKF